MSKTIASSLAALVTCGSAWMKPYRKTITRALVAERLAPIVTIDVAGIPIHFFTPAARALHDSWKIMDGEPETIRWLDGLPAGDVLWDIGANIGVYSLYAAAIRKMHVLAFEPSASSHAVLVRNIEINGLDRQIDAYNLAFDESNRLDYLHMAHTEAGHSMHAFGQTQSIEGEIPVVFRQAVAGFAIDSFCEIFAPPPPNHVKLDVDSIELKILKGAARTLARHVKTVLVEIDGTARTEGGKDIAAFLQTCGFVKDDAFMAQGARRNVLFRRKNPLAA